MYLLGITPRQFGFRCKIQANQFLFEINDHLKSNIFEYPPVPTSGKSIHMLYNEYHQMFFIPLFCWDKHCCIFWEPVLVTKRSRCCLISEFIFDERFEPNILHAFPAIIKEGGITLLEAQISMMAVRCLLDFQRRRAAATP